MSENVSLLLKANGIQIKGDSLQTSLGRQDSIECIYFDHAITMPTAAGSGLAAGKRQYQPILIRKRIDKSTPLLVKALIDNQILDAVFRFFRPNPVGDGTTEQFYTIHLKNARIASVRNYVPDTLTAATAALPPLEEVSFVFNTIEWTYNQGGITMQDALNIR